MVVGEVLLADGFGEARCGIGFGELGAHLEGMLDLGALRRGAEGDRGVMKTGAGFGKPALTIQANPLATLVRGALQGGPLAHLLIDSCPLCRFARTKCQGRQCQLGPLAAVRCRVGPAQSNGWALDRARVACRGDRPAVEEQHDLVPRGEVAQVDGDRLAFAAGGKGIEEFSVDAVGQREAQAGRDPNHSAWS